MTDHNQSGAATAERQFEISRTFDAPRELVFKAFSECEHLTQWWGPKGFKVHTCNLDFRPGGRFHYGMSSSGGNDMWGLFQYLDIVPNEKVEFLSSFSDPEGNVTRAPFSENFPLQIHNVCTYTESDGKTTLSFRGGPHNASEEERAFYLDMFRSMEAGFSGTFEQLEAHLAEMMRGQR